MEKLELVLGGTAVTVDISGISDMDTIYALLDAMERSIPEEVEFRARISTDVDWGKFPVCKELRDEISKEVDEYMYGHFSRHVKLEWGTGNREHPFDVMASAWLGCISINAIPNDKVRVTTDYLGNSTVYFLHGFDPNKILNTIKEFIK